MIQVKDLKKVYGGVIVVNIPGLAIRKGESIGLVGNNGAGKTTLFRMILDLIRPDSGGVLLKDEPVAGHENWKNYTAAYLDEGFLIDYLTPEEYFYFIGGLHQLNHAQADDFLAGYADFFNGEILKRGKYIRDLSKGNQTKVGIASCLLQNPELLMLDEPFANIDPTTQFRLKNIIKEQHKKGVTTIVSSHDLNHVTDVCNRILLMEKGKIIKDMATSSSTLAELKQYFAIGDTPFIKALQIDPEENH
ncbi:ABC transporter ATP-binding protein [Mucilaginibacter sp. UR6-11]|uniref:ABC transporter ATP-binding protein n=1 Tax=Mucilaginibacter sp. UR6-11 TaxID=1435644 RepID=UPI001E5D3812|nr:ABC transporter ATP-binding protein [Mucilaginibacter sp. UR6-11]MCC8424608.1 ABC transporter ATP-binding protein [Mucilaginibacter sp. UR6-11]